jgi:hypothetical protein
MRGLSWNGRCAPPFPAGSPSADLTSAWVDTPAFSTASSFIGSKGRPPSNWTVPQAQSSSGTEIAAAAAKRRRVFIACRS